MRTGSTWLVSLLQQISGLRSWFADTDEDAKRLIATTPNGLIKSHCIIDADWQQFPDRVRILRITRNYKDSLISRALYVKNIRPSEGAAITEPAMIKLIEEMSGSSENEFVSAFVDRCEMVEEWLAEIAVMERGSDERCITMMYEAMMKNPHDAMAELVDALWPGWTDALGRVPDAVRASIRDGFRQRETFLRKLAVGVGGWETWLTADQSERLDELFIKIRAKAHAMPTSRWPEVLQSLALK